MLAYAYIEKPSEDVVKLFSVQLQEENGITINIMDEDKLGGKTCNNSHISSVLIEQDKDVIISAQIFAVYNKTSVDF